MTGSTSEFYGRLFDMDQADPDLLGMALNTFLKPKQVLAIGSGSLLGGYRRIGKRQTMAHLTIRTKHPNNLRGRNKFHIQTQRVDGETLLKKGPTFMHAHTIDPINSLVKEITSPP